MSELEEARERQSQEAEFQVIRALYEQERYQEAYGRAHELVKRRGKITGMHGYLAALAYLSGKKEEACDLMRLAIGAFPRSRRASLQFINILAGCGLDSEVQLEIERFFSQKDAQHSKEHEELADLISQLPDKDQQYRVSIAVQDALTYEDDWFVEKGKFGL